MEILIPIAKSTLANKALVESMPNVKTLEPEPFANAPEDSQVTLLFGAMTTLVQLILAVLTLIVKLKETELCAGVGKVMKGTLLFNVL